MIYLLFIISCIFGLTAPVQGQPSSQLEQVFAGESTNCEGLSANIDVQNAFAEVNGEEIVKVVAESIAHALESGESAKAEATSIGIKILRVTAEAVAKIKAQVNSPNPGCWAVAYGKAEARAIASAVVDAIAEGASLALSPDVAAVVTATATTREQDIQEAVATVALLLAKGDGSGFHSQEGTATATAKATAINCAIAHAYAEIYSDDTATAETIVQAGCPPIFNNFNLAQASFNGRMNLDVPCQCLTSTSTDPISRKLGSSANPISAKLGAPIGCGVFGGADEICYVTDPAGCTCAQDSVVHSGQKWRFCGNTLNTMKSWLDFEDPKNEITKTGGSFGYCPTLKA